MSLSAQILTLVHGSAIAWFCPEADPAITVPIDRLGEIAALRPAIGSDPAAS